MLMGGAGSGKSYVAAQKVIMRILDPYIHEKFGGTPFKNKERVQCNWLIIRQTLSTHKSSTWELIIKIIRSLGIENMFTINKSLMKITYKPTGSFIIFKGLDDVEKLKSITDINNIWVEEISECQREAIDQLNLRLRGKCNYQQMVMTFNPISSKHWLKETMWDIDSKDIFKLRTTLHDNVFLPEETANSMLSLYRPGSMYHTVYVLGQWGTIKSEGALFHAFNEVHIDHCKYSEGNSLHLSFDFNAHPYSTCIVFQADLLTKNIYIIDEILEPFPATTQKLVNKVIAKYRTHKNNIYVYGDSSGKNKNTISESNNFDIIFESLNSTYGKEKVFDKILTKNPNIVNSVNFTNMIFDNTNDGKTNNDYWNVYVDSKSCIELIEDFNCLKSDKEGGKLKEMGKTLDGVTYEKYGHTSDCFRYFMVSYLSDEYNNYTIGPISAPIYSDLNTRIGGWL
jgi:PBSX family phage terminase large subunit